MKNVDVLIIGGGPAGLASGIVFARSGLQTMVCERKNFPRDKPCGEGLMPTGVSYLHKLGASSFLGPDDYYSFTGIRYHAPSGRTAAGIFQEGFGWGIRRQTLSRVLATAARTHSCLTLCEETLAYPIQRTQQNIIVRVGSEEVAARLLVGADGLNSIVRQWAGLQGPKAKRLRWGVSQHFELSPWSNFVEVHWGNGIEAYITPLGRNLTGAAFLWNPACYKKVQGGEYLLDSLLEPFPELKSKFNAASLKGTIQAVGPLQRNTSSTIANRVLLVGDASGYVDAITGEGISLALAQALSLEKTVVPILKKDIPSLNVGHLADYALLNKRLQRNYRFFTDLAMVLSGRPKLTGFAINLLRAYPQLFQRLVTLSMNLHPDLA
jgi:menaquinone-9 beta-reductase